MKENFEAEQYKPTPEEVAKAEDMMGLAERELTAIRENRLAYLDSIGGKGEVHLRGAGAAYHPTMLLSGNINGRKIEIERLVGDKRSYVDRKISGKLIDPSEEPEDSFEGKVTFNGETTTLTPAKAKELFVKYAPAAIGNKDVRLLDEAKEQLKEKAREGAHTEEGNEALSGL